MASGIYAIINQKDGKVYIGRAVDLSKRRYEHKSALKHNRHCNLHLQRAWNRGDTFSFSVIEHCEPEMLNEREVFWIKRFNSTNKRYGYNICEGGDGCLGRPCSDETRKKISNAVKGKTLSEESKKKRVETFKRHIAEDPSIRQHFVDGVPKGHREKLRKLFSGEGSTSAKLKEIDVIRIRIRYLNGEKQASIRKDYPQIAQKTISDICINKKWKSIPNTLGELEEMEKSYGA